MKTKNNLNMFKTSWRIYKKNKSVVNSMSAAFSILALFLATSASADNALPTNGQFVAGSGSIGTAGNVMNIGQHTQNGVINWGNFNIGSENQVNINNGSGATLNRVIGNNLSNINGQLNATGSVYLINQHGVVVGNTGVINAGNNAVLSTQDISNADFMAGRDNFTGTGAGSVANNGQINAGGKAVIIGAGVSNVGQIGATNVEITATGSNPYAVAINNTGSIRANNQLTNEGGRLVLRANRGSVNNSGTLDVSSSTGKAGEVVVTTKDNVNLLPGSMINAQGKTQGGNVYVGGGYQGADRSIQNAANTTVSQGSTIDISSSNSKAGTAIMWSNNDTTVDGTVKASGAKSGGLVETSGAHNIKLGDNFWANLEVDKGTLLIDPANVSIIHGTGGSTVTNTIKDGAIETTLNAGGSVVINTATRSGSDVGDITVANDVSVAWDKNSSLVLRANRDVNLAGTFDASANGSAASFRADAGRNINIADNTTIKSGTTGNILLNAAANVADTATNPNADVVSNWIFGTGAITHGSDVTLQAANIALKSGKAVDGTRTDIDSDIKLNSSNGTTFNTFQLSGFEDVDMDVNDNSALETTGGAIIINAKNINIDEDVIGKGAIWLTAASFNDTTNNFVGLYSSDPYSSVTDTRDEYRSDGWKTNHGTLNFTGNTILSMCCGLTLTSGMDSNGNRSDLTSSNVTFEYNDTYNKVKWFEVKGFDTFNTTIEGNELRSNSFVDIRNRNNVINYNVVAGDDELASGELTDGLNHEPYGYLRIMGGVFGSNNHYSDNIFNIGTTTFDNSLLDDEPLVLSASKDMILTSGRTAMNERTSITDETDTDVNSVSYAGRTDNVKFAHTDDNGQYDGNVRIEGFREIALDTSDSTLGGELKATGNINTWSSEMTNIKDNLTATNITSISENDVYLRGNSQLNATNVATIVVDEKDPFRTVFGSGEGKFVSGSSTDINANQIAIFTSRQPLNSILGQMNGQSFTAGVEFQGTAQEVWKSFYQSNKRSPRSPFVIYYKNDGQPQIVFSRPDCASNPDAVGCENFVQSPDQGREYRVNLTQTEINVGEDYIVGGNSAQVRNAEFYTTSAPAYVDYRLMTAEKLKGFATAFPMLVVSSTLQGINALPGFGGIAMALNGVVRGTVGVVTGNNR